MNKAERLQNQKLRLKIKQLQNQLENSRQILENLSHYLSDAQLLEAGIRRSQICKDAQDVETFVDLFGVRHWLQHNTTEEE